MIKRDIYSNLESMPKICVLDLFPKSARFLETCSGVIYSR